MVIRLTESARGKLRGMIRRPRSRKPLYRAEVLLALDEGRPIEEVARQHRMGVERIEAWLDAFSEKRLAFLAEPAAGRPARRDEPGDEEE